MEIDTSGRLRAQLARARADQNAATTTVALTQRDLRRAVTASYYSVLFARRVAQVTRDSLAEAQAFEARVRLLAQNGEAAQADVIKAQSEVALLEQAINAAELDARLANHELASFWTTDVDVTLALSDPLDEPLALPEAGTPGATPYWGRMEFRLFEAQEQGLAAEARAALAEVQANLERLSAGTLPTDIERARGQLETVQAALAVAQKVYDRRAELFQQGAAPQRDLLQSETELAQAKTNEEVARRSLELLQQQSGEQDLAIARSRVEQARARLEQASAQLQYTEIRSSFAGSVTEQFLYPGDMAKPDSPIFTVMDLSVAVARAQVPESQLSAVRAGQACEFFAADAPTMTAGGKVSVINQAVDPQRRTVEVWCEIPNAGHKLRAGAFGQVRIHTGSSSGVIVPQAAVQFTEGTHSGTVMVVDDEKIAHQRKVESGETLEGNVQILQGLEPGETVIVEGGYGLPDGTEVTTGKASK